MKNTSEKHSLFVDEFEELDGELQLEQRAREEEARMEEIHARQERRKTSYVKPPASSTVSTTMKGFRGTFQDLIRERLSRPGRTMLIAPAGVGKTYNSARVIIESLEEGKRVCWATSTNATAKEVSETLREHHDAEDAQSAIDALTKFKTANALRWRRGRGKDTCQRPEVGARANELAPNGWGALCGGCQYREMGECAFWNSRGGGFDEAQLEVTTHKMLTLRFPALDQARTLDSINWKQIARTARGGGVFSPWVRQTGKAKTLELKEDANGRELEAINVTRTEDEEGNEIFTLTEAGKDTLLEWFASAREVNADHQTILSAYEDQTDEWAWGDTLVIDESILENRFSHITMDALQFARFAVEYGLPHALSQPIHAWLADGDNVSSSELATLLSQFEDLPAELDVIETKNTELIEQAAVLDEDDAALELMRDGIDWRARTAWARFITHRAKDSYITNGELHLGWHSAIDFDGFRNVIVLDATGTEGTARAILGGDAECIDVLIEDAPKPLVTHIEYDLAKSHIENGAFHTRIKEAAALGLLLFDHEKTLYFVHKSMLDELEDDHPLTTIEGKPLHFLCSEARGSNKYKDFSRVVLHTFFENQQAVEALAYAMCEAAGDDWNDLLVREDWRDQAHFQKLGAVMIQHVERIRPINAKPGEEKEIIFTGVRCPNGLGYEVDLSLSPTELGSLFTGESHNRGAWKADPLHLKAGVARLGGCWAPSVEIGPYPHEIWFGQGSSEILESLMWRKAHTPRSELAWNRLWGSIHQVRTGFIRNIAVGNTGEPSANPAQGAWNQEHTLCDVLDRFSQGDRWSWMKHIGFRKAEARRVGGGAPAHIYHFEDTTLDQIVSRYKTAFEWIRMDDGEVWEKNAEDDFWDLIDCEVDEEGLSTVLSWSARTLKQRLIRKASLLGITSLQSRPRINKVFREVARRHAPGSTNHAEVIRALLEDRYQTPFIEPESSDRVGVARVVIERRDWSEYVEPGSIDHRYFYPWESMDVVRPTRFVSGGLALEVSSNPEVNLDAGVDVEMYDQERRRWRIWSMKAPGNLMHLWPDVSVWSRRKAEGLLPVDYPEGFEQMCMRPGGEQLEWMYRQLESERTLPPQPPAPGAAPEAPPVWRGLDARAITRELEGSAVMMEVARKLHDLVACWEPELDEAVVRDQLTTLFHRHGRYRLAGIAWGMAVLGTRFVGEEWAMWTWRLYLLVHQLEDDALPEPIRSLTPTQRVAWLLASKGDSCTLEEGLAVPATRRRTRSPDASSGHGALNIWRNQLVTARRWLNEGINVNPLSGGDFTRQWEEAGARGEVLRMPGAKPLDADALISLWGAGVRFDESDVWGGEDYQAWKIGLAFGHLSASGKPIGISPLWSPWMDNVLASWRDFAPEALRGHDFLDLSEGVQLEFIRWRLQAEAIAAGEDVYHVPWRGLRAMNILKALHDRHDALLTPLHHPALPEMGVPVKPGSSWYLAGESAPLPLLDVYERWMESGPAETLPYVLWRTRLRFVFSNSAGSEELVFSIEDTATLAFREHEISFWDLHELDQLTLLREHALALAAHHYRPPHWQVEWCVERYDGVYYPLEVECPSLGEANSVLRFILPSRSRQTRS
jgi:hypothetical protein